MTKRELIDHCLGLPDSYEDYPFDDPGAPDAWAALRHLSNRKCFAFIYERDGLRVNLKCEPPRADFLRGAYAGVRPAFHMNKEHWITVIVDSDVPRSELFDMIERSHRLTGPKR
ncbi:MAG: MmcQ/YjbR family DNA-binding protein [Clostridiales bacterium]|nr:MmcQ/YjbR family DNA-binding protein [Clostridiales bacterium]